MGHGSYNKVILIGRLGQDPDVRYSPNGNAVVNLNLATDESYKDRQSGQSVPKTEWHRVVLFGKVAEIGAQFLSKGAKILIDGKLRTRKWQNGQGEDRFNTEVVVDADGRMDMLDSKQRNVGSDAQNERTEAEGGQSNGSPDNGYAGNPC